MLSHGSADQKSKIKVSAGLVPSESLRENLFQASLLDSGGLLAICGIPWFVSASPQSLPSSSHGILLLCLCVQISTLHKETSHFGLGSTLMTSF